MNVLLEWPIVSVSFKQLYVQVWGCGGLQAAEYQSKLKQWEEKAILKSRNVRHPGHMVVEMSRG